MNFKQIMAIDAENKKRILALYPNITDQSGIYVWIRHYEDEDGEQVKKAYVGKSKKLLSRLASYFRGYREIENSIKKRGLFGEDGGKNDGWFIKVYYYAVEQLDHIEQKLIQEYRDNGYVLLNVESGGTTGKTDIRKRKPPKGYLDGIARGKELARREVAKYVEPFLTVVTNWQWHTGDTEKIPKSQANALEKFKNFLKGESEK